MGFKASACPASSPRANQRYWTQEVTRGIFKIYTRGATYTVNLRQRGTQKIENEIAKANARIMSMCGENPNSQGRASLYQKFKKGFFDGAKKRNRIREEECARLSMAPPSVIEIRPGGTRPHPVDKRKNRYSQKRYSEKCPPPSKNGGSGVRG
jgi:hypothetical protein